MKQTKDNFDCECYGELQRVLYWANILCLLDATFGFSETTLVLKVNSVLKYFAESGLKALIRTWLIFTCRTFFKSSVLGGLISMQIISLYQGEASVTEGTQTSRVVH